MRMSFKKLTINLVLCGLSQASFASGAKIIHADPLPKFSNTASVTGYAQGFLMQGRAESYAKTQMDLYLKQVAGSCLSREIEFDVHKKDSGIFNSCEDNYFYEGCPAVPTADVTLYFSWQCI